MSVILIDTSIIKCGRFSQNKTRPNYITGVLVKTEKKNIEKLNSFPVGDKRVDFVCSDSFSVSDKFTVFFNEKRKVCIIPQETSKILDDSLLALNSGFPKGVTIRVDIDLENKETIDTFLDAGFHHPFVTKNGKLALIKNVGNDLTRTKFSKEALQAKISHLTRHHKDDNCHLWARISKKALHFLHKICQKIDANQVEMTGELFVRDVKQEKGKEIFIIDINESSVESGEEENVSVSSTRYNFHSHPHQAYVNHSVKKAWPSSTDYVGYVTLARQSIFHIVTTLEGIYIISMSEFWGKNPENIPKGFINDKFNIDHSEPISIDAYVKKVNSIKYQKHPIFFLQFLSWKDAEKSFKVNFSKTEDSCIVSQDILENFYKFR